MNLLIIGAPIAEFPALPEIDHAYVWADPVTEGLREFLALSESEGVPVTIFSQSTDDFDEEILDLVSSVDDTESLLPLATDLPRVLSGEDIATIAWDGSDAQYRLVEQLIAHGVSVLDMSDGFAEMEIGQTPDVDYLVQHISARVTAEVLRVVRAEIREQFSARRWRTSGKKP